MILDNNVIQILVADDDIDFYEVLKMRLNSLFADFDINIQYAKDGGDAYRRLANMEYDLVFVDINMPYRKGNLLIQDLADEKKLPENICVVSQELEKEHILDLCRFGIKSYLVKPFDEDTLRRVLNQYVNKFVNRMHC